MKRLFKKCLLMSILVIIGFSPVIVFNYIVDPYGIFGDSFKERNIGINQRFAKMKYLINHPDRYDSYLFGSSRVGRIPNETITEEKIYNMTYQTGVPEEHLSDIQVLLKNNVSLKKVIIGLDNLSYLVDSEKFENNFLLKKYKEGLIERLLLYIEYLTKRPSVDFLSELNKDKQFKLTFDVYNTGRVLNEKLDHWIEEHIEQHVKKKAFKTASWNRSYLPRIDQVIEEIKQIKDLAQKHSFELVIFINPMHAKTYLRQDFQDYFEFLRKLSEITDFYDFSGVNEITTNNYYYYETSHYRPIVGEMILEKLYPLAEKKHNKQNFGMLVTKDNIEERIKTLESEIASYTKQKNNK